ncbi:MarR family winged helix-turn-helix transcriptional regulator [Dyadobacter sediminis]|uniref:HTH-type transcriptional regulator SarZ n=1 Tax=Dyadobacter sediminis TaxID=1493691 RepID=A0A5R9KC32_9BACT|nr:MarR family transcriptional regulator [Dyadobacter sediminis]TLU92403.1 MarR family transcriptional regulator [Dyadobacter sediminis]GGB94731.1 MarR family transcriptional regulator [Dyadobacter sediminis]
METDEFLKLENQLCFPLYAASRLVTKCYQPVLDEMGLTYPQYLVLLVLWEKDSVNLRVLSGKLQLQSNTLTPLLKRMQEMDLVNRVRSEQDERSIIISLTEKGQKLKSGAPEMQNRLANSIGITEEEGKVLHGLLYKLIENLKA